MNDAVLAAEPPPDTEIPIPSASDELNASARIMLGWWASSRCFTGSLHMAPDETIMASGLRSHLPWCVSSTASRGSEKGSPTITSPVTFSRSMESSISVGSYFRDSSKQIRPPSASTVCAVKAPVPCMRGQAGISVIPPGLASSAARTARSPPFTS